MNTTITPTLGRALLFASAVLITLACGDATPMLNDAATMLEDAAATLRDAGSDAQAQPVPFEPLVLDCELSYAHVQTNNPGEVDELILSRSGEYDLVVVEDPTRWVVEYCGRTTETTSTGLTPVPACGDANVECTGTEAPSTHCELALPKFTGTSILATCSTVTRIQRTGVDSTTTTTHESVRLVPR